MIQYNISTGEIQADGLTIGYGYAGHGDGLNNPLATFEKGVGPLPAGTYTIGAPVDKPESVGAFALPLTPDAQNDMGGRGDFYFHGDNAAMNHTASDGCIVTARVVRELISRHGMLVVIHG